MALSSAIVWEVRTTGSDTQCSGGFKAGATGTDYSQQDAAQFSGTNLVVDAVTNTKVTSITHNFVAADVGNVIQITAGAGWTTGFYEIVSVAANAATLDRSPAATGTIGGTWWEGGALATVGQVAGVMVASNTVYVKGPATFQITSTITPPTGAQGAPTRWIGYNSTRGDLDLATTFTNHPTVQVNNAAIIAFTLSNPWQRLRNFILDGAGGATKGTRGATIAANHCRIDNCKVTNVTDYGISLVSAYGEVRRCWVTSLISGTTAGFYASGGILDTCIASSNPCAGFLIDTASTIVDRCISDGNTGANSDGFFLSGPLGYIRDCVARNNGRDGIRIANNISSDSVGICNNILVGNGGYGLNSIASPTLIDQLSSDYNAYYNNTSGTVNGYPSGSNDVTLTADPFVDAANGNFALNTVTGGGGAARDAGYPGVFPGGLTTGYLDIGAAQHQSKRFLLIP